MVVIVPLRLGQDEIVGISLPRRLVDFLVRGIQPAVADVFQDGLVEEKRILADDADMLPQRLLREGADVLPIEADGAAVRIVKAEEERKHRAFARAAGPDQRVGFPWRHLHRDAPQGRGALRRCR